METAHVLESDQIRATVLPQEGGRIGSLISRESGVEFLEQPRHPRKSQAPSLDANFQDGPCAGIEECLPAVARSGPETEGGSVPDHGDFWQLAWQVENQSGNAVRISADGFSRPLRFTKQIAVEERSLRVKYNIRNIGEALTSFLYSCHPLLAVDTGDILILPSEVTSLALHYSRNERLTPSNGKVSWPLHKDVESYDLSVVLPYQSGVAEMLYTGRLTQGTCGLYRTSARQGIALRFNTELLPFLGIWLCYGAWPDGGKEPLQYAVALEPMTAPFGTLLDTQRAKAAFSLPSKDAVGWTIEFQVSEPNISLEAFRQICSSM